MPRKKMKIVDYFYEFAGAPKNKIITREMYQEIAKKLTLHAVIEFYAKNNNTKITESQLETTINMLDMQCLFAAEKKPELYDLPHSEINSCGFAPKAGAVSASQSAIMVNNGIKNLINYATSDEGYKQAIKNEYAIYLKTGDDTFVNVFNELTDEEKKEIDVNHLIKVSEQGFNQQSPDDIMDTIRLVSNRKAEYDSLSLGTRFLAFFGFGKAANLRKAIYGNINKLEKCMNKSILSETLSNPTESNLIASANSYLAGANRNNEVIVTNNNIPENDQINNADDNIIEKTENQSLDVNIVKESVKFKNKEFDDNLDVDPIPDDKNPSEEKFNEDKLEV